MGRSTEKHESGPCACGRTSRNKQNIKVAYGIVNELQPLCFQTDSNIEYHRVRQAEARGWSWSGVREKHCYLAGGWRLELEGCERETL